MFVSSALWWHGSRVGLGSIDWRHRSNGGLHIGSMAQAQMRGPVLQAFRLRPNLRVRRCKDTGRDWKARADDARARGFDAIVYLNRYEGLDFSDAMGDVDLISDQAFKRMMPASQDSLLILKPCAIEALSLDEMLALEPVLA